MHLPKNQKKKTKTYNIVFTNRFILLWLHRSTPNYTDRPNESTVDYNIIYILSVQLMIWFEEMITHSHTYTHFAKRCPFERCEQVRSCHNYWIQSRFAFKLEYSLAWNTRTATDRFHFSNEFCCCCFFWIEIRQNLNQFFFLFCSFTVKGIQQQIFELVSLITQSENLCAKSLTSVDFNFSPLPNQRKITRKIWTNKKK